MMAQHPLPVVNGHGGAARDGRRGAAVVRTRDAYRDVPILKQPTWGHEVAAYFFFGGVSAGAAVLGSLASLIGAEEHKTLARTAHYVSFAALLPCPPLLIDDLGKPSRFYHMLRIVKPSSPMNLGAWALTVHGGMATLTVARMLVGEGKLPLVGPLVHLLPEGALAVGALPSALTLGGYTGVLLGTSSIPVWFTSPLLGALFMASSLSTGAAATNLVSAVSGRDERGDHGALTSVGLALGVGEAALLGGYVATSGKAAKPLLRGKTGLMVAGAAAALAVSTAIEAASLITGSKNRSLSIAASALTLVGGGLLRWGVVGAGKVSATDREGTLEAMTPSAEAPGWGL